MTDYDYDNDPDFRGAYRNTLQGSFEGFGDAFERLWDTVVVAINDAPFWFKIVFWGGPIFFALWTAYDVATDQACNGLLPICR